MPRKRRKFSEQFKADAVDLVLKSGKAVAAVANDLDLTESTLGEWVKKAQGQSASKNSSGPLQLSERAELEKLRDDVKTLRMERDFLKKAAAFFAKESN